MNAAIKKRLKNRTPWRSNGSFTVYFVFRDKFNKIRWNTISWSRVTIATKNNPKTCLKLELFINFVFTLEQGTSFWSGIKSYRSNFCKNRLRFCFLWGTKELWSSVWVVFKSNSSTKLIRILVLLEKLKIFFRRFFFSAETIKRYLRRCKLQISGKKIYSSGESWRCLQCVKPYKTEDVCGYGSFYVILIN